MDDLNQLQFAFPMKCGTRAQLEWRARSRPSGYIEDVLAVAVEKEGLLCLGDEDFARLAAKYATPSPPPKRGLGDVAAAVFTPIARALKLPCIDPATKQLRPESKCAQRKADWNRKFPLGSSISQP